MKKEKRKKESKLYKWHRDAVVLNNFSPFNHSLCPVFDVFLYFCCFLLLCCFLPLFHLAFCFTIYLNCVLTTAHLHMYYSKQQRTVRTIQHNDERHTVCTVHAFLMIFVVVGGCCAIFLFCFTYLWWIFPTVIIKIAKYDISRIDEKVILNPF